MPHLSVKGCKVHYTVAGQGDPVLLLHSGASTGAQWRAVTERLKSEYRIVAMDFYGMGGTQSWPGAEPLEYSHEAALACALLELFETPVHLVGHSYGASVALRVAIMSQNRLRSLTAIEPLAIELLHEPEDEQYLREYLNIQEQFMEAHGRGEPGEAWRHFFDYRNGDGAWAGLPDTAREKFLGMTDLMEDMFRMNYSDPISLDQCARLNVPSLFMCGEHTTPPDHRTTRLLASIIPGARHAVVPQAAHMSPLTHPEAVSDIVKSHLADAMDKPG